MSAPYAGAYPTPKAELGRLVGRQRRFATLGRQRTDAPDLAAWGRAIDELDELDQAERAHLRSAFNPPRY